jgi:hypothetical protein
VNIIILELLEKISVEYVEENIMENEKTESKRICECGRVWKTVDFYYGRCASCLEFIPANIVVEGWR